MVYAAGSSRFDDGTYSAGGAVPGSAEEYTGRRILTGAFWLPRYPLWPP